ncbi:efflux RND transporter periplasmic adaptor subunit [Rhizobium rhizogenes]|uniref:efflux RND transporter periplasmic adaptor subunit n=1 Tax=Rhizobium rhizogenes TaxID=359 RepID=UPI0015744E98|nr:efflux RND transporter periplasmic adaptor subunit [Rhizobium rhizogenes]NTF40293.1 efflux RND transporter periplasmic adaptor subunit [Rhizobium rhizogenes]
MTANQTPSQPYSPLSLLRRQSELDAMTRRITKITIILALVALGVASAVIAPASRDISGAAQIPQAPTAKTIEVTSMEVMRVHRRTYSQEISINGFIQPARRVTLTARLSGTLASVEADVGTTVRAGDVIARFDTEALTLSLNRLVATTDAKAATLLRAQKDLERTRSLVATGGVAQAKLTEVETDVAVLKAELRALQAEQAEAQRALNDAVVTAPFDGIVNSRRINPGQAVSINTELFEIVDIAQLDLVALVPPQESAGLSIGQTASIRIEGLPDETLSARLDRISPATLDNSRSLQVYLRLQHVVPGLRGGMFGHGSLQIDSHDNILAVPAAAIITEGGETLVRTIIDGAVHRQPVTLGTAKVGEDLVEVRTGLSEGDAVITVPLRDAANGTSVKIAER